MSNNFQTVYDTIEWVYQEAIEFITKAYFNYPECDPFNWDYIGSYTDINGDAFIEEALSEFYALGRDVCPELYDVYFGK